MARWGNGPLLIGAAGRPRFSAPLMVGLAEWGGLVPTPPLYKKEEGMAPHNLSSSLSFHLGSALSSAMARGGAGPSTAATRVSARQRAPPSQELVAAEPAMRGRGRGRGQGWRGARGRGGRGGAPALPLPVMPPPMAGHVGDQPREFFIRLHRPPCRRLRLAVPFAQEMELNPPRP